jgi:hypothetical protein
VLPIGRYRRKASQRSDRKLRDIAAEIVTRVSG